MNVQTQAVGNLTANPVLRAHEGRPVANLRIANTPRVPDGRGGFRDGTPIFLDVVAWGPLAENAAKSLKRGDAVIALGRLVERRWTPTDGAHAGQEQVRPELIADVLGASLQFATVAIAKVAPSRERE